MGSFSRRRRAIEWLAGIAVFGIAGFILWRAGGGQMWWDLFSDQERLRRTVESFGLLAPVVFFALLVIQAVLAPLPAPAVAVAGGYLFGTLEGFLLTWTGVLAGGALSFGLSRALGRRFVTRSKRLRSLDAYVEEHGAVAIFVLRLIPLISFDVISYAAGLTGISFWRFMVATALGSAPATFVFVHLGTASFGTGTYIALSALGLLGLGAYAFFRRLQRQGDK